MAPRRSTSGKKAKRPAARKPSTTPAQVYQSLEYSQHIKPLDSSEVDLDLEAIKLGHVPGSTRGRIEKPADDRLAATMENIAHRRRVVLKAVQQERSSWRVMDKDTQPETRRSTPEAIADLKQSVPVPTSFPESNIRPAVDGAEPTASDRANQSGQKQVEGAFQERTGAVREGETSALLQVVDFEGSPVSKCPVLEALGMGEDQASQRLPYPLNNKEFLQLYVAPLFEMEMRCGERHRPQEPTLEQRKARLLDRLDRCEEIAARVVAIVDAVDRQWEGSLPVEEADSRAFFRCRDAYRQLEQAVATEAPRHSNCPYWTYTSRLALMRAEKRVEEQIWKTPMLVENIPRPANDQ
ncbi:hypothetical protein AYO21_02492 [Fonsecaea monophora]|uniref:Uncharacterized protein n=1 Tax=Fonsecaea monophora TaxID=254056 RepID=A0A177FHM6_9EURO|nr:hypothetical protein AYO21_02492 [Fonsecaea monophora]OAG43206.1 hypothetical protein AYO21_02492 [Fonsecaea monophora]